MEFLSLLAICSYFKGWDSLICLQHKIIPFIEQLSKYISNTHLPCLCNERKLACEIITCKVFMYPMQPCASLLRANDMHDH